MSKIICHILAVLCCCGGVWAQELEIAFVLKGKGNPYWKSIVEGVEETAREKKVKALIYQLENDQASESQLNTCYTALERKPRVLVLGASTKSVGIQCYKEAARRGVIFADIDANVTVQDATAAGLDMAFSVGSDNFAIGELAADQVKAVALKPNPKVLVLAGITGSIVSKNRVDGFVSRLKKILPDAVIVGTVATEWDRLKAANATADYLQRDPDLNVIYSASDMMTAGVVESVKMHGKSGAIQIVSVDGNADMRKAIVEGRIVASVAQLPYLMGKRAVELAIEAAHSSMTGRTELIPTPLLTKEVLAQNQDPNLQYVR